MTVRLLLSVCALACLAVLAPAPARRPSLHLSAASGALRLLDSRQGSAVVAAANMRPGTRVSGDVTIESAGKGGPLWLDSSRPSGSLAGALRMTIATASGQVVASGAPAAIAGCHSLGPLPAGRSRGFRFSVELPRSADNAYQGDTARVDESWTLGASCGPTVAATRPGFAPRISLRPRCGRHALLTIRTAAPLASLTVNGARRAVRARLPIGRRRGPLRVVAVDRAGRRGELRLAACERPRFAG